MEQVIGTNLDETIFSGIGRYQFNYTGASNYYYDVPTSVNSNGYSFLGLNGIEYNHNSSNRGNSSGAKLELNSGSSVKKAYLVLQYNQSNEARFNATSNWYITISYNQAKKERNFTPTKSIECIPKKIMHSNSGNNSTAYMDITNFVKENESGYYYCSNIPSLAAKNADESAAWKIIVIEENIDNPLRALIINFNYVLVRHTTSNPLIVTLPHGLKIGNSTNEPYLDIIYGLSNVDPEKGNNVIEYAIGNKSYQRPTVSYNGYVIRSSNYATRYLFSINGKPIEQIRNCPQMQYINTSSLTDNASKTTFTTTPNEFPVTGDDAELITNIPITSGDSFFKVRIGANKVVTVLNTLGIVADIDGLKYKSTQATTVNNENSITITGKSINTKENANMGLIEGDYIVTLDSKLKVLTAIANVYKNGVERTIKGTINHNNHTVTFKGIDTPTKDDFIEYTIECSMPISSGSVLNNNARYSGYYCNNGEKLDYIEDATVASSTANIKYRLIVNPNKGIWKEKEESQTILLDTNEIETIPIPTRKGYTFEGWELSETDSTMSSLKEDNAIFTMGTKDTILTAKWKIKEHTLEIEPNGGIWGGSTASTKITMNYGGTKEIPVPSRNSYHFTKWILAGEGSHITDASANHATFTMGDENAKLTAQWELITHSIKGNIIWNDQENAYGTRPSEGVQVTLKSDEAVTAEGALEAPFTQKVENGEYTFKNLQTKKEKDNTNYEYTVSQNKVLGYETVIDGYNIVNNLIVPSYTSQIKTTPVEGDKFVKNKEVQVVGTVIASDKNRNKVGLCDEEVRFEIDEGIKIDRNSVKISYIDKDGTIKNITKYIVEGNTIKVKFESNKTSNVTAGDSIKIEIKGTLEEVKTYTNTISYSGNLREYENGEKTTIDLGVVTKDVETIENVIERTNKVTINLKDIDTEEYVEGAVLQIVKKTEENGKIKEEIIKEWTTGKEDTIYEDLPEGNYIIREIKLPENDKGYVKIEDKPIKVEEDKEQIIELKQDHTKVTLEIVDEETKEKIDDIEIEIINKETGEVIKVKETEEGYIIEKVPEGDYIVRQKTPEGYQEVEDIEITIEGTGKTQIKTVENKKLVYDMQVEKELESIWVNGEKKTIRKGNMQKIEIKESKIETEDIKLDYIIRVSNVGGVKATIGNIIDNLPEGFKLVSTDWKQEGNQAIWDAKTEELNPGESKEVRITVQWENNASNFGEKKNTAEIKESTNLYNYKDKKQDNDLGEATVIFSIKTGSEELMTIIKIVDVILVLGIVMCFMINRKK